MPPIYLFDIGNVILTFDFTIAATRLAEHDDIDPAAALASITDIIDELEVGQITPEEFIARAAERTGYTGSAEAFREAVEDIFKPNHAMIEFINQRHQEGAALHLLSNTSGIHVPYIEARYPVFQHFSGRIYSFEVKCMKPDPAIYRIATQQLNLIPEETVYIDDRADNCAAGEEAGFLVFHYDHEDHPAFLRYIDSLKNS